MSRKLLVPLFLTLVASAPTFGQVTVSDTSTPGTLITFGSPFLDTIAVLQPIVIATAEVDLDITHTFQGDLDLSLSSTPSGVTVELTTDNGGSLDDVLVTFSSVGGPFDPTNLAGGATMQAEGPGAMSDFVGDSSVGFWSLSVTDDAVGDDGTLNSWTIRLKDTGPPVNNDCADAIFVDAGSITPYDTTLTTASGVVPTCALFGPNDVWFGYNATCDGQVLFSLCTATYDSLIAVYDGTTGCPVDSSTQVDCVDDDPVGICGPSVSASWAQVYVTAGTTYFIQVGGRWANVGTGDLEVNDGSSLPLNDTCSGAEPIGEVVDLSINNLCATQSGANPGCGTDNPFDLWYEYTATCAGNLEINTFGSTFDTLLAVWDACGGAVTACNDDWIVGTTSSLVLPGVSPGDTFLIQVGGSSSADQGAVNLTITCSGIIPVTDLTCVPGLGSADVSWTNGELYDSLEIYVDGTLVDTLPGDAVTTTVTSAELSTIDVCVRPILAGTTSVDTCCTLTIPCDCHGLVVIVDGDSGGLDNQAAVEAALIAAGESPITVGSILDSVGAPAELFVLLGTFPNNTVLTADEGQAIADAQAAGTPVFVSGGDTWGFDAPTAYNDGDGIDNETALDGDNSFLGGVGAGEFAGFDFVYTQEQVGFDYYDRLDPATDLSMSQDLYGTAASIAWSDDGTGGSLTPYNTGIFYDADGAGNALNISWEIAGYGGDQDALVAAIRAALSDGPPPGPEFVRGDTNADGLRNIADAINLLGVLFPSGAPTNFPCEDAGDTNDDGLVNIADAINLLGVLFPSGAPAAIPAPEAGCGEDPTADALGCDSFPACP